jgi:hypothetical protein
MKACAAWPTRQRHVLDTRGSRMSAAAQALKARFEPLAALMRDAPGVPPLQLALPRTRLRSICRQATQEPS